MTRDQEREWEPVLTKTLERCRAFAKTTPGNGNVYYPCPDDALEEAARTLARIMAWDRGGNRSCTASSFASWLMRFDRGCGGDGHRRPVPVGMKSSEPSDERGISDTERERRGPAKP
jgi:hypothetical protein